MVNTEEMAEGWEEFEEELDDDSDLFQDIYVETATNRLHEVHMFDTFCLVRMASPNFYAEVRKLTHIAFARDFHEYGGDPDAVREYLRTPSSDFMVE